MRKAREMQPGAGMVPFFFAGGFAAKLGKGRRRILLLPPSP